MGNWFVCRKLASMVMPAHLQQNYAQIYCNALRVMDLSHFNRHIVPNAIFACSLIQQSQSAWVTIVGISLLLQSLVNETRFMCLIVFMTISVALNDGSEYKQMYLVLKAILVQNFYFRINDIDS